MQRMKERTASPTADGIVCLASVAMLVMLALLAVGCAGNGNGSDDAAQVTDRWQEPRSATAPAQRYGSVFVIGIAHSDELRRAFEDEFVRQLAAEGVNATPSYGPLPQTDVARDEVVRAVRASGADGVVITRLLRREQRHRAALSPVGYHTHYSSASKMVYTPQPPVVYRTEVVTLETRLFDADREQMIWAATTELFDPRATQTQVGRLVRGIIKEIKKASLI
jgi:hypothetical protein